MNLDTRNIPAEAVLALQNGKKVEAIKIIRQESKMGLKDSKDLVDAYLYQNPSLNQQFKSNASTVNVSNFLILIVLAAIGFLYFMEKI